MLLNWEINQSLFSIKFLVNVLLDIFVLIYSRILSFMACLSVRPLKFCNLLHLKSLKILTALSSSSGFGFGFQSGSIAGLYSLLALLIIYPYPNPVVLFVGNKRIFLYRTSKFRELLYISLSSSSIIEFLYCSSWF